MSGEESALMGFERLKAQLTGQPLPPAPPEDPQVVLNRRLADRKKRIEFLLLQAKNVRIFAAFYWRLTDQNGILKIKTRLTPWQMINSLRDQFGVSEDVIIFCAKELLERDSFVIPSEVKDIDL